MMNDDALCRRSRNVTTTQRRRRQQQQRKHSHRMLLPSLIQVLLILIISHFCFRDSISVDSTSIESQDKTKDDDNDQTYNSVYLIIEGTIKPYFQCSECYQDLLQEQEYITDTLQSTLQQQQQQQSITLQVLDTSYKFINSIYVQINISIPNNNSIAKDAMYREYHHVDNDIHTVVRRTKQIVSRIEQWKIRGIQKIYISQYHLLLEHDNIVNKIVGKEQHRRHLQQNVSEEREDVDETIPNNKETSFQEVEYSKPLRTVGVDIAHQMTITKLKATMSNHHHTIDEGCYHNITGHGIRIAILDGGIDYTHVSLGGIGTKEAYTAAYGTSIYDVRNTQRDTLFPTSIVIDGYDVIGDTYKDGDPAIYATSDDDPIDLSGHGTAVAHVIRSVAPDAKLIGIKICSTIGTTCPDFAFVRGMEYLLDRNHDNVVDTDINDIVHVVNLSLGRMYASGYYSVLSKVTEEIISYGIIPVLSSGNYGNIPFILGDAPATPNAITVGATVVDYDDDMDGDDDTSTVALSRNRKQNTVIRTMAPYSSRGPVSEGNRIKPDLVSPGGPYRLAQASTGNEYRTFQGTSFAAPFVAGGAALLKQKCMICSPMAIKALLMNHAVHTIFKPSRSRNKSTTADSDEQEDGNMLAPVTLQGSGEMQIHRSLLASYWVYCIEDINPSISLGLINAASRNITIQRTLLLTTISNTTEILTARYEMRSQLHQKAISIDFEPSSIDFDGKDCLSVYYITVTFIIHTQYAPSNHMYSGGAASTNPHNLDYNEIDGWIILSNDNASDDGNGESDVNIPFHMLLRKAANVSIDTTTFDDDVLNTLPMNISVNLENHGMETAQIDSYQLIYLSTDKSESEFGSNNPPADIRYVGYRTVPVSDRNISECDTVIEFAIQTWESQQSLSFTHFNVWIDLNFDEVADHTIYNSAYRLGSTRSEMRRIDLATNIEYCVGYTPDHTTNTANTVLRFCSNDIGINTKSLTSSSDTVIGVAISSYSFPDDEVSDMMEYRNITIPFMGLSAPSYDIEPGATLREILFTGTGLTPLTLSSSNYDKISSTLPLGLLLFTNSFRSWTSTGSATRTSEAVTILRTGIVPPKEFSADSLTFPIVDNIVGPLCGTWQQSFTVPNKTSSSTTTQQCRTNGRRALDGRKTIRMPPYCKYDIVYDDYSLPGLLEVENWTRPSSTHTINDRTIHNKLQLPRHHRTTLQQEEICPELIVPRVHPIRITADDHTNHTIITPTSSPTTIPPKSTTTTTIPTILVKVGEIYNITEEDESDTEENANGDIEFPSSNKHVTSTIPPLTIDENNDDDKSSSSSSRVYQQQSLVVLELLMMMYCFCII